MEHGMKTAPALSLGVLLGTLTCAAAQTTDFASGTFYLPLCKTYLQSSDASRGRNPSDWTSAMCVEVVSTVMFLGPSLNEPYTLCIPRGANPEQGVRVVVTYLEARPQRLRENFRALVREALASAWGCR
jgi:hypothetical protein